MSMTRPARPESSRIEPQADFLALGDVLTRDEAAQLDRAKGVFADSISPLIPGHWDAGVFPAEAITALQSLDLVRLALDPGSALLHGLMHVELAKVDLSMSTFLGIHGVLFTGAVATFGTEHQKRTLLPDLLALRRTGAFALTEASHGSDISRGIQTTATRRGDTWTINGAKRWIGNGTHSDYLLVWARDEADSRVKGFIVDRASAGVATSPIANKIGLRIVQNADILLRDVEVPESRRLTGVDSFHELNELLTNSRAWVAWQTVGVQYGAYDQAVNYALQREQFGRPIGAFQLVQQKLVRILDNATASAAVMRRIAELQQWGKLRSEHASLAKAGNSARMRETVSLARELFGGNGLVTDYGIARSFADAEAIYSYEGTYDINTLVVGRAITGISAIG